ncbi:MULTISPECIES: HEAT repeat domain-containing protein [unclassified Paenibacillus]|uniref:HEAT repeat domain-containing protein n=1 Tax=unclassified Paenibacillus TaxID=185978 RepID=UPI002F428C67
MDSSNGLEISAAILQRKGASKAGDIPQYVLEHLQAGVIATVNLTEWLAVDHSLLLKQVLAQFELQHFHNKFMQERLKEKKIMKVIPAIANGWRLILGEIGEVEGKAVFQKLSSHPSDSVRCWAAYIIGLNPELTIAQKLPLIRPFAGDEHFGVREIAWMAVREAIINELEVSLFILKDWLVDHDEKIRRFAIEAIRPNGVWAKHITRLKERPEMGLPLLEIVKSDSAKYVQDSVSNWLNDASKSNPEWVKQVCARWTESSNTKETNRIVKRALRSLK